ncbi:MAG: VOC family protein [Chloroflexota bacterium]|nr:VOC family protein [Chloroflexota bacterium]
MLKKMTPNLMVEDVNRTIEFYSDVLGFELLVTVPEKGQFNWAMMKLDDVELMFQARSSLGGDLPVLADAPIGGSLTFYTEVTGLKELYEQCKDQVEIVQEWHTTFYGTQEFAFRDCNGYIIAYSEALGKS